MTCGNITCSTHIDLYQNFKSPFLYVRSRLTDLQSAINMQKFSRLHLNHARRRCFVLVDEPHSKKFCKFVNNFTALVSIEYSLDQFLREPLTFYVKMLLAHYSL